jgi:hypothetical protein
MSNLLNNSEVNTYPSPYLMQEKIIQGSLFEEDYLIRTLGSLGTAPDVALTELVANAWDAGATIVDIFIPEEIGQKLTIEDNGIGLTKKEFHTRWMKLGYNEIGIQPAETSG